MPQPLDGAFLRLERADKRLSEFEAAAELFAQSQYHRLSYEFDSQAQIGRVVWQGGDPPPLALSVSIGEVIYNLRAALDYLVYEMARLDSNIDDPGGTQFPIESLPSGFAGKRRTYLRFLNDTHITAIEGLQPCKGCQWTKTLADLSNPDKHRKLTASRGTAEYQTAIAYGQPGDFQGLPGKVYPAQGRRGGEVLDVYLHADITIEVEFLDGAPVVATLSDLCASVSGALDAFKAEFER